jgi:hypothetical protein
MLISIFSDFTHPRRKRTISSFEHSGEYSSFGFGISFEFLVSDFGFSMWDLFDFFRYALAWVVTIYALIVMAQSAWGWYVWLAGSDQYISLIRRYVIVHGLRLRFRAFWGDVIICLLLSVVCVMLWVAHSRVDQLKVALDRARQPETPISHASIQH